MNVEQPNFAPPRDMRNFDGTTGTVSYGTDDGLIVEFYVHPKHMEFLSESIGHPIFQDRIMTRIVAPGNNKTVWVHETKGITYETAVDPDTGEYHTEWTLLDMCPNGEPTEPSKYPKAWARFNKRNVKADAGWPIEEWPAITRSMAESLKMLGIPTVEAMAAVSDANAQSIMGGNKFRNLARAALDEQSRNRIVAQEQTRADQAEEQAKGLLARIEELGQVVRSLQSQLAQNASTQIAPAPAVSEPGKPQLKQRAAKQSQHTKDVLAKAQVA